MKTTIKEFMDGHYSKIEIEELTLYIDGLITTEEKEIKLSEVKK